MGKKIEERDYKRTYEKKEVEEVLRYVSGRNPRGEKLDDVEILVEEIDQRIKEGRKKEIPENVFYGIIKSVLTDNGYFENARFLGVSSGLDKKALEIDDGR